MFIVWYPLEFSRLFFLHPWYWNSLIYSLISSGKNSAFAHFAVAIGNHYNLAFLFHQVPMAITVEWREAAWYLPNTSTHCQQCEHVLPLVWELWSDQLAPSWQCITCSLWHVHWECHISSVDCSATFLSSIWNRTPGSCVIGEKSNHWTTTPYICMTVKFYFRTRCCYGVFALQLIKSKML